MTPTEKAKELIEKFYPQVQWKMGQEDCMIRAKKCALIAVDEVLNALEEHRWQNRLIMDYWEEIKKEIKSL